MKFSYFPGCSLKGTGKAYEQSFLAVFKALGIEVEELENWNCCGATAYMSVDEKKAFALAARNLAIAEKGEQDVLAPCSACYLVLNKAQRYIEKYPKIGEPVKKALGSAGLSYEGTSTTRHPLDVLVNDIGIDAIKEKVTRTFGNLKVACYYGCQIVRPYALFDSERHPSTMDQLMEAVGAETVEFPNKTKCCGGSLTGTLSEVGERLCYHLLKDIKRREADVIVTLCPLCQFNLEVYQDQISSRFEDVSIPVLYFTQLLGLGLGLSEKEVGLNRQIVSAKKALKKGSAPIVQKEQQATA